MTTFLGGLLVLAIPDCAYSTELSESEFISNQGIEHELSIERKSGLTELYLGSQKEEWFSGRSELLSNFFIWKNSVLDQNVLPIASLPGKASHAAADLGGVVFLCCSQNDGFEGESYAQSPTPGNSPPKPPSDALNLPVLRSLKKPVGKKVLDTGVAIAGINPKDISENFWTRDFLTGNWGGARDRHLKQGIDVYLATFSDIYGVVSGGNNQNTAFNNVVLIGFDLYTTKLGWWKEGQIHVTAVDIRGVSVGRDYAGALNSVYFVDPIKRGSRLFEVWYGQKFGKANEYEIRLGKIFPFVRLAASQSTGIFTNTAFQYPSYLGVSPISGMSTPFASAPLGIQFSYTASPQWIFLGQIQDGFDDPTGGRSNQDGLNTGINAKEGIEGIIEAVYRANQERGSTGLPGFYRLGFQFHSGMFKSQSLNQDGRSLALFGGNRKENWGNFATYFMADQMIFRESPDPQNRTQGLNVFFKTTIAPKEDINTISLNIAGGLAYEGLIPGRDRDVLGLGVSYSQFSDGIRTFERQSKQLNPNLNIRDAETVLEVVYVTQITPWWYLIGSIQRIFQPSGKGSTPDATVIGISSRFAF